jgi:hypothetical protein
MKLVLTFFLFFFYCLFGHYNTSHAGIHHGIIHPRTLHYTKNYGPSTSTRGAGHITTKQESTGTGDDRIIGVEDEDEDIINKQVPPARALLAFYYAFISTDPRHFIAPPLPFSRHLSYLGSCKYIAERVLRI